jgi:hypothetical protein
MNDEEKTYKKLIEDLKNLPKVEAPKNFETELWRKINSSEETKITGFWEKLFSPARLAPAALAIVSAAIIFFVIDVNSEVMEDPLNIAPRLREDLVVLEPSKDIPFEIEQNAVRQKEKSEVHSKEMLSKKKDIPEPVTKGEGDDVRLESETKVDEQSLADDLVSGRSDSDSYRPKEATNLSGSVAPSPVTTSVNEIRRDNVNFMQRNLSSEEKVEVQQLKLKIQTEKSSQNEQKTRKQP